MGASSGPDIIDNGLVLALDAADRNSYPGSGTTWTDLSGNGNNGTLVNGVGYNSGNGGSLSFDGSNDYVTLGTKNIITTDFSVNMWVKVTAATKEVYFFSFGYNDSESVLLFRHPAPSYDLRVLYFSGGSGTSVSTSYLINQNVTYNISWTRSGANNILYINGVNIYSFNDATPLTSCIYDIGWATTRNKSTAYHQGNIYNTMLYDRALTSSEIQQNFNALRSRFSI